MNLVKWSPTLSLVDQKTLWTYPFQTPSQTFLPTDFATNLSSTIHGKNFTVKRSCFPGGGRGLYANADQDLPANTFLDSYGTFESYYAEPRQLILPNGEVQQKESRKTFDLSLERYIVDLPQQQLLVESHDPYDVHGNLFQMAFVSASSKENEVKKVVVWKRIQCLCPCPVIPAKTTYVVCTCFVFLCPFQVTPVLDTFSMYANDPYLSYDLSSNESWNNKSRSEKEKADENEEEEEEQKQYVGQKEVSQSTTNAALYTYEFTASFLLENFNLITPNKISIFRIYLVSIGKIRRKEEIVVFYGQPYWAEEHLFLSCHKYPKKVYERFIQIIKHQIGQFPLPLSSSSQYQKHGYSRQLSLPKLSDAKNQAVLFAAKDKRYKSFLHQCLIKNTFLTGPPVGIILSFLTRYWVAQWHFDVASARLYQHGGILAHFGDYLRNNPPLYHRLMEEKKHPRLWLIVLKSPQEASLTMNEPLFPHLTNTPLLNYGIFIDEHGELRDRTQKKTLDVNYSLEPILTSDPIIQTKDIEKAEKSTEKSTEPSSISSNITQVIDMKKAEKCSYPSLIEKVMDTKEVRGESNEPSPLKKVMDMKKPEKSTNASVINEATDRGKAAGKKGLASPIEEATDMKKVEGKKGLTSFIEEATDMKKVEGKKGLASPIEQATDRKKVEGKNGLTSPIEEATDMKKVEGKKGLASPIEQATDRKKAEGKWREVSPIEEATDMKKVGGEGKEQSSIEKGTGIKNSEASKDPNLIKEAMNDAKELERKKSQDESLNEEDANKTAVRTTEKIQNERLNEDANKIAVRTTEKIQNERLNEDANKTAVRTTEKIQNERLNEDANKTVRTNGEEKIDESLHMNANKPVIMTCEDKKQQKSSLPFLNKSSVFGTEQPISVNCLSFSTNSQSFQSSRTAVNTSVNTVSEVKAEKQLEKSTLSSRTMNTATQIQDDEIRSEKSFLNKTVFSTKKIASIDMENVLSFLNENEVKEKSKWNRTDLPIQAAPPLNIHSNVSTLNNNANNANRNNPSPFLEAASTPLPSCNMSSSSSLINSCATTSTTSITSSSSSAFITNTITLPSTTTEATITITLAKEIKKNQKVIKRKREQNLSEETVNNNRKKQKAATKSKSKSKSTLESTVEKTKKKMSKKAKSTKVKVKPVNRKIVKSKPLLPFHKLSADYVETITKYQTFMNAQPGIKPDTIRKYVGFFWRMIQQGITFQQMTKSKNDLDPFIREIYATNSPNTLRGFRSSFDYIVKFVASMTQKE